MKRGNYDSLRGLGLNDRISSVRPVNHRRQYDNAVPQPLAAPNYEYRRRPNERIYEAQVKSARAVMGAPEQRCWMEQQPASERRDLNVPGGLIGGLRAAFSATRSAAEPARQRPRQAAQSAARHSAPTWTAYGDPASGRGVQRCTNRHQRPPAVLGRDL